VKTFELTKRALADLQSIWAFVSDDSFDVADRLLDDFYGAFNELAAMPRIGHKRDDLTQRNVLFWRLHSYLIIYKDSKPLRIVRIIHGKRDVKSILKNR
jgi:plasmid stabilization system protein ParE